MIVPPIFTSDGKTERLHLYISLVKLVTNSNLCIIVSLVIQYEISVILILVVFGKNKNFTRRFGTQSLHRNVYAPCHYGAHVIVAP